MNILRTVQYKHVTKCEIFSASQSRVEINNLSKTLYKTNRVATLFFLDNIFFGYTYFKHFTEQILFSW